MNMEFTFWLACGCVLAVPSAKGPKRDHVDTLLAPPADPEYGIDHRSDLIFELNNTRLATGALPASLRRNKIAMSPHYSTINPKRPPFSLHPLSHILCQSAKRFNDK
jgi:hypothetical protein